MLFEKILAYCEKEQISLSEFERRCDLGHGLVGKYKDDTEPTIKTLRKIAQGTETTVGEWLS